MPSFLFALMPLLAATLTSALALEAPAYAGEAPARTMSAPAMVGIVRKTDYAGQKLGIMNGTIYEEIAREHLPDAITVRFADMDEVFAALEKDLVKAILAPETIAIRRRTVNGRIRILKPRLISFTCGFVMNHGNQRLREELNSYLRKIKHDKTYDDMLHRWLEADITPVPPDIETDCPNGELVFATSGNVDVFSYMHDGLLVGFDIELAKRFARSIGKTLRIVTMNFADIIPAVEAGTVELGGNIFAMTPERKRRVAFSDSYFQSGGVICVKSPSEGERVARAFDMREFNRRRIAFAEKSDFDLVLALTLPEAQAVPYPSLMDCVAAVKTGEVEAMIANDSAIRRLIGEYPELIELYPMLTTERYGFAVSPQNRVLANELDSFLGLIRLDGTYGDMIARWLDLPVLASIQEIVPADGPRQLLYGTLAKSPRKSEEDRGFELEFAKRFASHVGAALRTVELPDAESLVTALVAGEVDFAADPMNLGAAEKERLAFTVPYYVGGAELCILRRDNGIMPKKPEGGQWSRAVDDFQRLFMRGDGIRLFLSGLKVTLVLTIGSLILGGIVAAGLMWLERCCGRFAGLPVRGFVFVFNGVPVLILLLAAYYFFTPEAERASLLPALACITLVSGAHLTSAVRGSVRKIRRGEIRAAELLESDRRGTVRIVPPPRLAVELLPSVREVILLVLQATSVVGYLEIVDLTRAADLLRQRNLHSALPLVMAGAVYLLLSGLFLLAWRAAARGLGMEDDS